MPLEHACGCGLDRGAVGDVDLLVLVRIGRPARQPDDMRSARLQRTDELCADSGARAGDDGYLQILSTRPAAALWPAVSVTVATRWRLPFLSFAVFHVTE